MAGRRPTGVRTEDMGNTKTEKKRVSHFLLHFLFQLLFHAASGPSRAGHRDLARRSKVAQDAFDDLVDEGDDAHMLPPRATLSGLSFGHAVEKGLSKARNRPPCCWSITSRCSNCRHSRKPLPGPAALRSASLRRPRKGCSHREEPNYRTNFTPATPGDLSQFVC